jgi:hypothetical protein
MAAFLGVPSAPLSLVVRWLGKDMTAQVEFFCSPDEEREVLRYLSNADAMEFFDVRERRLTPWKSFSINDLSDWPDPLHIYLWQPTHGSLIWHTLRPEVAGSTNRSFVMNFFARGITNGGSNVL